MKILITGAAGFIGFHIAKCLLKEQNVEAVGLDNINDYYDVNLKYARLSDCGIKREKVRENTFVESDLYPNYKFIKTDISDAENLTDIFNKEQFSIVIHMAAQAGVRYSLENPATYTQSNLVGFANILECSRQYKINHLLYASSSSVYGMTNKVPFCEDDNVDFPVSYYAATKKSNELTAHSYSHLYRLPTTGIRFFTVYGPWGRPDMAPMIFTKSIYEGKPINVFNNGDMERDFTYVDDVVKGVVKLIDKIPDEDETHPFYRILNIGNSKPVKLLDFIHLLEKSIGKNAALEMKPMQPGDVKITYADTAKLEKIIDYKPQTALENGISQFIEWYKSYYNQK
ncbi:MAG: GDP-mannose 4,6-dehydratase [Dysgonomonas sp.]